MARAKRIGAEKVTLSIDSDVLLEAKHKALDLKLTLSDYVQGLLIGKATVKVTDKVKREVKEKAVKKVKVSTTEERFREVWHDNMAIKKGRNSIIAGVLNSCGQYDKYGDEWTQESVRREVDRLSKKDGRAAKLNQVDAG